MVALASATNVTLALRLDPALRTVLAGVVHLGGAFFVNGNVNPAAEANIFGDPEAADELYRSGAAVTVIGLDVTQRLMLMKADLEAMRVAAHPHTCLLYDISQFYMDFHVNTVATAGIYMHDPAAVLLAFRPDLFTCRRGRVRVATEEGVCRGQTVLDQGGKLWSFENAWTAAARPEVAVALDVDIAGVMRVFRERFDIKGGAKGSRGEGGVEGGGGGARRGLVGMLEKGGRAFFELLGKDSSGGSVGGGGLGGTGGGAGVGRRLAAKNVIAGLALVGAGAMAGIFSVAMREVRGRASAARKLA